MIADKHSHVSHRDSKKPVDGRLLKENYDKVWQLSGGTLQSSPREMERARAVLGMIPLDARSVLEVGCGDGLIINQVDVPDRMGLDVSEEALKNVSCPVTLGTLGDLPFPDRSWDVVIASEVIEHLAGEEYPGSLKEMNRVASRYIIVSVPNRENMMANQTKCPACGAVYHRNFHVRSYGKRDLAALFEDFSVAEFREIGDRFRPKSRMEMALRHHALGQWAPYKNSICPVCRVSYFEPGDSTLSSEAVPPRKEEVNPLRKLVRVRRTWLAALYARSGGYDLRTAPSSAFNSDVV